MSTGYSDPSSASTTRLRAARRRAHGWATELEHRLLNRRRRQLLTRLWAEIRRDSPELGARELKALERETYAALEAIEAKRAELGQ